VSDDNAPAAEAGSPPVVPPEVPDLKPAPDTAWLKTEHIRASQPPPDVIFRDTSASRFELAAPPEEQ
jgi:hypothetical protein